MRNVHLVTGSKGGIGKTMCVCSLVWAFDRPKLNHNITVIDLNWHNPDSSRLLSLGSDFQLDKDFIVWHPKQSLTIARYDRPFSLPNGSAGFWERLISGLKISNDDIAVVDSCAGPLNFLDLTDNELYKIKELLDNFLTEQIQCYLWFLWTRESLTEHISHGLGGNLLVKFDRACNRINEIFKDYIIIKPIHVMNPHALYKTHDVIELFLPKTQNKISGLSELASRDTKHTNQELTFKEFDLLVRNTFSHAVKPKKMFLEFQRTVFRKYSNRRPRNIFALSHHCGLATGFPGDLLYNPPEDVETIVETFKPLAEDIEYYLEAYY